MLTDVSYARVPNGHGILHQLHSYEENNNTISSNNNLQIESKKMRVYPNPSNNRVYVLGSKRIESV